MNYFFKSFTRRLPMNAAQNNSKKYGKGTLILTIVISAIVAIVAWETLRSPNLAFGAPKYTKPDPLDAGVQRQTQIAEQRTTNARLGEIVALLKSGQIKVIAVDEKDAKKGKKR